MHFLVDLLHLTTLINLGGAAPIGFQIVESPGGVLLRVLLFVTIAALVSGARLGSRGGVDAVFNPLLCTQSARAFMSPLRVGLNSPRLGARSLRAIIDIYVHISRVLHAIAGDSIGCGARISGGDFAGKVIPAIPGHGRSGR